MDSKTGGKPSRESLPGKKGENISESEAAKTLEEELEVKVSILSLVQPEIENKAGRRRVRS